MADLSRIFRVAKGDDGGMPGRAVSEREAEGKAARDELFAVAQPIVNLLHALTEASRGKLSLRSGNDDNLFVAELRTDQDHSPFGESLPYTREALRISFSGVGYLSFRTFRMEIQPFDSADLLMKPLHPLVRFPSLCSWKPAYSGHIDINVACTEVGKFLRRALTPGEITTIEANAQSDRNAQKPPAPL